MNADLHCHSTLSDGLLPPADLVRLAARNGVTLLSLTDHDETSGLAAAREAASRTGIDFVGGVEISVSWRGHTLHVVGLRIDEANATLSEGLASIRDAREIRAHRIAEELARVGIEESLEGARRQATNPALISRTHFARFLVERNRARDVKSVFQRFLARGKPGYVAHEWIGLEKAVGWIVASGGVAVVAHPARYGLSVHETDQLLMDFREAGGRAVEVVTASHTPDQVIRYTHLALKFDLAASRGSDYHGPGESRVEPGKLAALPPRLKPVWELF